MKKIVFAFQVFGLIISIPLYLAFTINHGAVKPSAQMQEKQKIETAQQQPLKTNFYMPNDEHLSFLKF